MPSTHSNLEIPLSERPHPTLLPILNQKSLESSIPAELLQPYLDHLSTPLQPLVSCIEGRVHPDFPRTLLQYHLLTSNQLDNLAWHFHQISPPIPEFAYYPIRVTPWLVSRQNIDLETKRRRFGRFIGLQGCDSPVQGQGVPWEYNPALDSSESLDVLDELEDETETVDQMLERMQCEWEEALVLAIREDGRIGLGDK